MQVAETHSWIEAAWLLIADGEIGLEVVLAVLPAVAADVASTVDLQSELLEQLSDSVPACEVEVVVLPTPSIQLGYRIVTRGLLVKGEDSSRAAEATIRALGEYFDFTYEAQMHGRWVARE